MRLFFDTNVILDALADREPAFQDSAAAHSLVDKPEVEGFPAARSGTAAVSGVAPPRLLAILRSSSD